MIGTPFGNYRLGEQNSKVGHLNLGTFDMADENCNGVMQVCRELVDDGCDQ